MFYYSVFCGQNEKGKEKRNMMKKNYPPPRGFEPRIFEQVPAENLNFEGD